MVLENEKKKQLRIGPRHGLVWVDLGLLQSLILKPKELTSRNLEIPVRLGSIRNLGFAHFFDHPPTFIYNFHPTTFTSFPDF